MWRIGDAQVPLVGRAEERRVLAALVSAARDGSGGSLVVRGDPGIGKTSLVRAATAQLTDVLLLSVDGFEAESTLPFAGVQRIGMPLADHIDALPPRFATALRVATGYAAGPPPEPFLVGLALLALIAESTTGGPVVVVVDDAHLLDPESLGALAFVARRLDAESILLLIALRDGAPADALLAGLPELRLTGLDVPAAVALVSRSSEQPIDPVVAVRVAEETGGNPLALVDLARDLTPGRLSELSLSEGPVPIGHRLEGHYLATVRAHDPDVQSWLLVAAAASGGDPLLIERAVDRLGIPARAATAAEAAGLVSVGTTIRFRHPLVRSAVYGGAAAQDRRHAHTALGAEALARGLVELAAWHRAEAAFGVDDDAADRLQEVADRAGRRGGFASRARLLARAADLTSMGPRRAARLLDAAEAAGLAGAARLALDLVDRIPGEQLDDVQRGRTIAVRASLAAFLADPVHVARASAEMLDAADAFAPTAPERERRALLFAFQYALPAERSLAGTTVDAIGRRIRSAVGERADDPLGIILSALASLILDAPAEAAPRLRTAVATLHARPDDDILDYGALGAVLCTALWDGETGDDLLNRLVRVARERGSLRILDAALWTQSLLRLGRGDPAAAGRSLEHVREVRRAMGFPAEHVVNAAQLAWSGAPPATVLGIAEAVLALGFGGVHSSGVRAVAIQDIAAGHYRDAFERLKPFVEEPFLHITPHELTDFVEAAERSGNGTAALAAMERLEPVSAAIDSPWLTGVVTRCRALLLGDALEAEPLHRGAVDLLSEAGTPADLGRAHLLYGEWLRRQRRRRDARTELRLALDVFERVEAPVFAARARAELEKTGDRQAEVRADPSSLTPQESAVARLAARGRTNAEIASALFISTSTVDYHLRKVFQKLGISSRRLLAERLGLLDP
ncbi:helix-turn-helix transcriptional regulator [Labedella endophytica]|uniref:Helix-turn-helix transcriptional regulator n=1 Tax=Labedella endophytica TaxID=1523160 RepID=A0A3S0WZR5_9MICO|nr:helix-turn-helix transcriptional regulator [Labedella endophytica]